jgi:hypothetical protein
MREAVGVIQLDQFLPQPVQLGFRIDVNDQRPYPGVKKH